MAPNAQSRLDAANAALEAAKAEVAAAQAAVKAEKKSSKRKRETVDVEALKKAVKKARKAMKADKNKETKAALKEAKAALEAAEKEEKEESSSEEEEEAEEETEKAEEEPKKVVAATSSADNPTGCCKVFLGNLSFQITDEVIKEFFQDCGTINDIHWLEDKESGRFKGCGFCTFDEPDMASKAVAKTGAMVMDREIRVDFSLPKPGRAAGGGGGKGASKFANKPLSEKPAGCNTVFAGNLSFDIDEDAMRTFAEDCGEIAKIRWLTDRESGDFKGCGFVEFYEESSVDKFVLKNGTELLGRQIRLDYSAPRQPK